MYEQVDRAFDFLACVMTWAGLLTLVLLLFVALAAWIRR